VNDAVAAADGLALDRALEQDRGAFMELTAVALHRLLEGELAIDFERRPDQVTVRVLLDAVASMLVELEQHPGLETGTAVAVAIHDDIVGAEREQINPFRESTVGVRLDVAAYAEALIAGPEINAVHEGRRRVLMGVMARRFDHGLDPRFANIPRTVFVHWSSHAQSSLAASWRRLGDFATRRSRSACYGTFGWVSVAREITGHGEEAG